MRAARFEQYGPPDVVQVVEIDPPVLNDDEVLVRVVASTVNRTDCGFRTGKPRVVRLFAGLTRPRRQVLGTEFAGVVEQIGSAVTDFVPGDEVFGVNADRFGAHAELLAVKQTAPIARMPADVSFEDAAALCDGAVLALTCLRWAGVTAGQRIMIYGASGAIGTAGVQLAKHLGAHVTAVCNTANVDTVRALGADEVIDYTTTDFVRGGEDYDVVFDAVGKISFARVRPAMKRRGRFVATDFGPWGQVPILAVLLFVPSRIFTRRVSLPLPRYRQREVLMIKELVEQGRFRAVVDRTYPLDEVVEATRYVESEQKTGNVVLRITPHVRGREDRGV